MKVDIDCLTSEDLAEIVKLYGGENIEACKHCNKIQTVPPFEKIEYYEFYDRPGEEYRSACDECGEVFPSCCVWKSQYSEKHYERHPTHVWKKDGENRYPCRSCVKKRNDTEKMEKKYMKKMETAKNAKKRKREKLECPSCSIPESDCEDVPFSRCKKCREKVCEMCILNDLCVCCHDDLGYDTKGLRVGDRVIYSDCGPILTEATVKRIHKIKMGRQKIQILCDRDYEWNDPPKAINVYRKCLRKI